jgi:prevent-host-death family protein
MILSMTRRYSVAGARNHLPAVLHEAEHGEPVEITRYGKPVAVLLSAAAYYRLQQGRPDLWDAYQAWRSRGAVLGDADVEALADRSRDQASARGIEW